MEIKVFEKKKKKIGSDTIDLFVGDSITVGELKNHIFVDYPELDGEVFQVAKNESFVKDDEVVTSDDSLALIPPVSGG